MHCNTYYYGKSLSFTNTQTLYKYTYVYSDHRYLMGLQIYCEIIFAHKIINIVTITNIHIPLFVMHLNVVECTRT